MSEDSLHFCYLDESGSDLGRRMVFAQTRPVFVLAGFIVPADGAAQMTREFLAAKCAYDPERFRRLSVAGRMENEVKGSALLRRLLGQGGAKQRRQALAFLRDVFAALERLDARLVGRWSVKTPGKEFDADAAYASCLTAIVGNFEHFLAVREARGMVWCDLRRRPAKHCEKCGESVIVGKTGEQLIVPASRAVFERKFGGTTDDWPRLLECPAFADSVNHAGIQIADILCSALIGPIAAAYYRPDSPQADARIFALRDDEGFGERLSRMQLLVADGHGGLTLAEGGSGAPLFGQFFPDSPGSLG